MIHLLIYIVLATQGFLPVPIEGLQAEKVYCDHLDNVYIIEANRLEKYNADFELQAAYDYQTSGVITTVDVSNPLRILVYSANANEILFLDKQMSIIGNPVLLDEMGYYDVSAVCSATRGGFWLHDAQSQQIVNIDQHGNAGLTASISERFSGLPNQLYEKNNKLFLGFEEQGIMVYNVMGAHETSFPLKYQKNFKIINQNILYLQNNTLFSFDYFLLKEQSIFHDAFEIQDFAVNKNTLYYVQEGTIHISDLQLR
ncbi:MAG: hypothetical protein ACOC01_03080 [Bacteroidales bacterium]